MARQLNLDRDKLDHCYELASHIISHAAKYIERHSSTSIECASLLSFGLDRDFKGRPLASTLIETLTKDELRLGALYWFGRAYLACHKKPDEIFEKLARRKIKWVDLPPVHSSAIHKEMEKLIPQSFKKEASPQNIIKGRLPLLAMRTEQTKRRQILNLFRPHSPKDISLFPVVSIDPLSQPTQAYLSIKQGSQTLLLDGWIPIFKGEVDPKRSLVDHFFSLLLCSKGSVRILSNHSLLGEQISANVSAPQLLAQLLLYEQLAKRADVPLENIIFSTAPLANETQNDFSSRLVFAQVLREMFPQSLLWYRLPQLHFMDIFVATFSEQDMIELCTDRESDWKLAEKFLKQCEGLGDELLINTHGKLARQAHLLLDQTWKLLKQIHHVTLWKALEDGILTSRPLTQSGKGGDGIFQKSYHYWNPLLEELKHLRT